MWKCARDIRPFLWEGRSCMKRHNCREYRDVILVNGNRKEIRNNIMRHRLKGLNHSDLGSYYCSSS
jgi:hypothetical protein